MSRQHARQGTLPLGNDAARALALTLLLLLLLLRTPSLRPSPDERWLPTPHKRWRTSPRAAPRRQPTLLACTGCTTRLDRAAGRQAPAEGASLLHRWAAALLWASMKQHCLLLLLLLGGLPTAKKRCAGNDRGHTPLCAADGPKGRRGDGQGVSTGVAMVLELEGSALEGHVAATS